MSHVNILKNDENGQIGGVITAIYDISAHLKTEAAGLIDVSQKYAAMPPISARFVCG